MENKDRWGFSSEPVHVQVTKDKEKNHQEPYENDSDSSPHHSDTDESLCCCPSLSDMFASCSDYCRQCFCCCRSQQDDGRYSKVNYRYLQPEKSQDSIDGGPLGGEKHVQSNNLVFQFPQQSQKFPTHPSLPFKLNRMELRQPQMKFTPGGGDFGHVVLPETPFPAPYLYDHGPGLQTPFVEQPIQRQLRAINGDRGGNGLRTTAMVTQRKKRFSRTRGKQRSLDMLDFSPAADESIEEKKERRTEEEEDDEFEKRQVQGRQMSLPSSQPLLRGRKRLFSMSTKRAPVDDKAAKERKHRLIHRARTVGSSPSRQPSIDPEKYRRCQTPELTLDSENSPKSSEGKKGLALRKCRTPDVIMMRSSRESMVKRESDSPESTETPNLNSSSSLGTKSEGPQEEETELAGDEGGGAAKKDSLVTTDVHRRRWVSRRDKSRKDSSQADGSGSKGRKSSKTQTLPAHVTSSTPSYLASGSLATDGDGDGASAAAQQDPPLLYFSLYFDIQRRALTVNLVKVVNLPRKPPNQGSCDPFVMMFLLPNKQEVLQSVIKQRTLNPEFKQVFEFGGILANDLKNQVLVFRVFDHDRFSKNDLIGTVIMPLKDADLYGMLMRREVDQRKGLLKQFSAGDLLFSLTYSQERQILGGIILKATNLRKADIWGLADPYVKVYVIYDNKRINKWKTEVKKNTLVPIYNESFQFDVSGMDIRNVSLEVWIMDYDWFSRNDKMGVVYVGANSPQEVGRSHWLEILSSPEHQTSHWHTIIPYTDLKQVLHHKHQHKQKQQTDFLQLPPTHHRHHRQQQQQEDVSPLSVSHDSFDTRSYVSDTPTI